MKKLSKRVSLSSIMRKLDLFFILFAGETLSGKVALEVEKNHPGCWMADNLEEMLTAKIKKDETDVDADDSKKRGIDVCEFVRRKTLPGRSDEGT